MANTTEQIERAIRENLESEYIFIDMLPLELSDIRISEHVFVLGRGRKKESVSNRSFRLYIENHPKYKHLL